MKKSISVFFLFVTVYANANTGVIIYGSDTSILGFETNQRDSLITSTLYGGSNDSGASSPADCVVKYNLTPDNKNFKGDLIPFSTDLMDYGRNSKNVALFEVNRVVITFTTSEPIDACPLGTDFTGDYSLVGNKNKEYKSDFESLIKFNHYNALKVHKTKGLVEASVLLKPYVRESITNDYYFEDIFNDYGYLLQQAGLSKDAISILKLVIQKSPKRTVAYLNIADAYWDSGDKATAYNNYNIYISLMKKNGRENKIPPRATDRVK